MSNTSNLQGKTITTSEVLKTSIAEVPSLTLFEVKKTYMGYKKLS